MKPPELVLFDCDGVLVNSERITCGVLRDDLARHGLVLTLAQVDRLFVGGTMQGVVDISRSMGAQLPESWLDDISEQVLAALSVACEPVAGIDAVLDRLDIAGVGFIACSNGSLEKMTVTLTRTGLWHRFDGRVYSAQNCTAPKPAPDIYLKAAADAGLDPACCSVIEDSSTGARAGQAAGMAVFGYAAGGKHAVLAPHCVATFDEMADLTGLLGL
jgi:HAD superfamily hydrolase (TIGR01509 family)